MPALGWGKDFFLCEIIFHSNWELGAIASNPTGQDPTAATGDVGTVCGAA